MNCNVFIRHLRGGRLIGERAIHNVWTYVGHEYLASMVGALSFSGDPAAPSPSDIVTPESNDRIRYMGVGIGGVQQSNAMADLPPMSTSYPVGAAEERYAPDYALSGYTNGKQYNNANPTSPRIGTLERPVRVTGSSSPYSTAPGSDVWRIEPPNLFLTHFTTQDVTVHATIDAASGDVAYPPFDAGVPLSEAGLFSDGAGTTPAYAPVLAYVTFDTIVFDAGDTLEFIWQVKFG
jgi:hypothetical protein